MVILVSKVSDNFLRSESLASKVAADKKMQELVGSTTFSYSSLKLWFSRVNDFLGLVDNILERKYRFGVSLITSSIEFNRKEFIYKESADGVKCLKFPNYVSTPKGYSDLYFAESGRCYFDSPDGTALELVGEFKEYLSLLDYSSFLGTGLTVTEYKLSNGVFKFRVLGTSRVLACKVGESGCRFL